MFSFSSCIQPGLFCCLCSMRFQVLSNVQSFFQSVLKTKNLSTYISKGTVSSFPVFFHSSSKSNCSATKQFYTLPFSFNPEFLHSKLFHYLNFVYAPFIFNLILATTDGYYCLHIIYSSHPLGTA